MGVGLFTCKNGYFGVNYTGDDQWQSWVEIMGNPEWSKDEALATQDSRVQNRGAPTTKALIEEWAQQYTKDEIRGMAQAKRVPLLPTNTIKEIVQSPQMQARGYFVEATHSSGRKALVPGAPYNFSSTPWSLRMPAPRLGEHTGMILREHLGVNEKELADLRAAGIV
jgi:crotonobetainyl-CoA:carnitine CoA-transferase CaiB-like acyl-CoA transferase